MSLLAEFENKLFAKWAEKVPDQVKLSLNKSLLKWSPNRQVLLVNFDPQVSISTLHLEILVSCIPAENQILRKFSTENSLPFLPRIKKI